MLHDWIGYLGAGCVLTAFSMQGIVPLRIVAIAGNLCFIAYALAAGVTPVLVMNALLLPLNLMRLAQALRVPVPGGLAPRRAAPRLP
jgi:hypothetical protein